MNRDQLVAYLKDQFRKASDEIANNDGETLCEKLDREYIVGYRDAVEDVLGYVQKWDLGGLPESKV